MLLTHLTDHARALFLRALTAHLSASGGRLKYSRARWSAASNSRTSSQTSLVLVVPGVKGAQFDILYMRNTNGLEE